MVSAGVMGDMGDETTGRLIACEMGSSIAGLDIKTAGVILSKPCRAWPAKFPIFCIVHHPTRFHGQKPDESERVKHSPRVTRDVEWKGKEGRGVKGRRRKRGEGRLGGEL